ncbi:MAG: tetratricopeptide repeat protein, partial [Geminicoccaceae bacterium]
MHQTDAEGCNHLGFAYRDGLGVGQDHEAAVALFDQACRGGIATSCTSLGFAYANGEGVAQNQTKAAEIY